MAGYSTEEGKRKKRLELMQQMRQEGAPTRKKMLSLSMTQDSGDEADLEEEANSNRIPGEPAAVVSGDAAEAVQDSFTNQPSFLEKFKTNILGQKSGKTKQKPAKKKPGY